jgi:hypothetical protein
MAEEGLSSGAIYQRRVVAFYDVLGWRSKIAEAGNDPAKIAHLQQIILIHSRIIRVRKSTFSSEVSTFSDNVVISMLANEYTPLFLQQLAILQASSAMMGFLIRGGVTIGNLVHDNEVVFGPALNRAYEIESTVAEFPRIVLDSEWLSELRIASELSAVEDGVTFLDPFTANFLEFLGRLPREMEFQQRAMEAGFSPPPIQTMPSGLSALQTLLNILKRQLRAPLADKEYNKTAWLYDRIANRLGVPPASSYPRVRPIDAAE